MTENKFISVPQAWDRLRKHIPQPTEVETVSLMAALGRVLAEDQLAPVDVPPADNSAMDGFALRFGDLVEGASLPVSQRIPAGLAPQPLAPGTAARLFTGSEIPPGADTVVMQENCDYDEQRVTIHKAPSNGRGDNVRPRGQDIQRGQVLLRVGQLLRAPELGLLASVGIAHITVFCPIKVAVVSTGDELVEPGQPLDKGRIYNSNRYLLAGLLRSMGVEVVDMGSAKDDPAAIEALLRKAAEAADCVMTTGGVSVGEEDHVKSVLLSLGHMDFWKIAIKPGKPLAFGTLCGKPFFGLPGNPVSAFVTFVILVWPFLRAMRGNGFQPLKRRRATAGFGVTKAGQREEYRRAVIERRDDRDAVVPLVNQSSGVLTSVSRAEVLAIVPPGQMIAEGDSVDVIDLDALLNP